MQILTVFETLLLVNVLSAFALRVEIFVNETQGVRVGQFPVQVVVPLPKGNKYTIDKLSVSGVPSQVEVLERWPSDNSLRNVLVHFLSCRPSAYCSH